MVMRTVGMKNKKFNRAGTGPIIGGNKMNEQSKKEDFRFDLGTFGGILVRDNCPIPGKLTAGEVVNWNPETQGEAKFWPSGDCVAINLLFIHQYGFTVAELLEVERLLGQMGGGSEENLMKIYFAMAHYGLSLKELDGHKLAREPLHVFSGKRCCPLRRRAADALLKLYHPVAHQIWQEHKFGGLRFDTDGFLNSPDFHIRVIDWDERFFLLVAPQFLES